MRKHGFLIAVIMFGLTWAEISRAEDQPIEQQLIDAMNKVFGVHPRLACAPITPKASLSKAASRRFQTQRD